MKWFVIKGSPREKLIDADVDVVDIGNLRKLVSQCFLRAGIRISKDDRVLLVKGDKVF